MANIEVLKPKIKTLLEQALAELDGDVFTAVLHLEEAVTAAEELEDALTGLPDENADEDATEYALVESEDAALMIRKMFEALKELEHVDVEALSAWTIKGISLFPKGRLPKLTFLVNEARRVLVTRAHQLFDGNITHAARAMSTSRRTTRTLLERFELKRGETKAVPVAIDRAAQPIVHSAKGVFEIPQDLQMVVDDSPIPAMLAHIPIEIAQQYVSYNEPRASGSLSSRADLIGMVKLQAANHMGSLGVDDILSLVAFHVDYEVDPMGSGVAHVWHSKNSSVELWHLDMVTQRIARTLGMYRGVPSIRCDKPIFNGQRTTVAVDRPRFDFVRRTQTDG